MSSYPESMPVDYFMFRAGRSAPRAEEPMLQLQKNMREIGDLRNQYFFMGEKTISAPDLTSRTLGVSISDEILEMFNFAPVGNAIGHSESITSPNQITDLSAMLKYERINIQDSNRINNLLVFGESAAADITEARLLKSGFHEVGHALSAATTPNRFDNVNAFYKYLDTGDPLALPGDLASEWTQKLIGAMGDLGLEEARAESFTSLMSKTTIGKDLSNISMQQIRESGRKLW